MQEIINFVWTIYLKYTFGFTEGLVTLLDDPVAPVLPNPANEVVFELWKLDVKEYHNKLQE